MTKKDLKVLKIVAKKKARSAAKALLWAPSHYTEPLNDVQAAEIHYYRFTLLNLINTAGAITFTKEISEIVLPTLWNYMDGFCSITLGLNQLLDEDNYRQNQMKVKGMLNIISGVQLFVLSYNPAIATALGVGLPTVLAGASFALATMIDAITASIDFYNAFKEKKIGGWLEEKQKEHAYLIQRIESLRAENKKLAYYDDYENLMAENNNKISNLEAKKGILEEQIIIRYKVNHAQATKELEEARARVKQMAEWGQDKSQKRSENEVLQIEKQIASLEKQGLAMRKIIPNFDEAVSGEVTNQEKSKEAAMQKGLDDAYKKTRNTLLTKTASFIGMTLLAVGGFALFTTCPPALLIVGMALTVAVATVYFLKHSQVMAPEASAAAKKQTGFFGSGSGAKDSSSSSIVLDDEDDDFAPEAPPR